MNTLHVLMPPLSELGEAPAWRRWLARGDRASELPNARSATIRELFNFPGNTIPVAALRHHCHADDARGATWLCADPAWVRSEATGARLMACPIDDLTTADAAQLAATLRPLLGDAGVPLTVDAPSAWCVRLTENAPKPTFVDPTRALGAALLDCLPEGDAGRKWRYLFNEVQMALHGHAINTARVAEGRRPVNAAWFWGVGALPDSVATPLAALASSDDVLRGLAKLADVDLVHPEADALQTGSTDGDLLLDLGMGQAGAVMHAWLTAFQQALDARRFGVVALTFADGPRYRVKRAHRWRIWRRA